MYYHSVCRQDEHLFGKTRFVGGWLRLSCEHRVVRARELTAAARYFAEGFNHIYKHLTFNIAARKPAFLAYTSHLLTLFRHENKITI